MIDHAWLHTLDPVALRIPGLLSLRWYGLSYMAGFVVAAVVMARLAARNLILIPRHRVMDAMVAIVLGVIVGGRLGYVVFYDLPLLWSFDSSFPFWGVLQIQRGGMASHGGMIGVVVASFVVSRGFREPDGTVVGRCSPMHVMDTLAITCVFGLCFGRLANFVNGELLGRIAAGPGEAGPRLSVRYPQELSGWYSPTDAGEHAQALTAEQHGLFVDLVGRVRLPGDTFHDGVLRLIGRAGEFPEEMRQIVSARWPSQLLQAMAEGPVLGAALWLVWAKPRRPGVVSGCFLMFYGVLRVLTELVRLPDAHLAVQRVLGLSRGQWLSVVMILAGAGLLLFSTRRRASPASLPLGGWLRRSLPSQTEESPPAS